MMGAGFCYDNTVGQTFYVCQQHIINMFAIVVQSFPRSTHRIICN